MRPATALSAALEEHRVDQLGAEPGMERVVRRPLHQQLHGLHAAPQDRRRVYFDASLDVAVERALDLTKGSLAAWCSA